MRNMAGQPPQMSQFVLTKELKEAGIKICKSDVLIGEPNSPVWGELVFETNRAKFTRAWFYWIVELTFPMPQNHAEYLNRTLGSEIRVNGYAGGQKVNEDITYWHVDTQRGLNALVEQMIWIWGEPTNKDEEVDIRISGIHWGREKVQIMTAYTKKAEINYGVFWNQRVPLLFHKYDFGGGYYSTITTPKDKRRFLENLIEITKQRIDGIGPINEWSIKCTDQTSARCLLYEDSFEKRLIDSQPFDWTYACFGKHNEKYETREEYFNYYLKRFEKELEELQED